MMAEVRSFNGGATEPLLRIPAIVLVASEVYQGYRIRPEYAAESSFRAGPAGRSHCREPKRGILCPKHACPCEASSLTSAIWRAGCALDPLL